MDCLLNRNESGDVSLDGLWDFTFLGAVEAKLPESLEHVRWEKMWVPSAFDATVKYPGKRGVALYRRTFFVESGRECLLSFGAISMWSRVYVDGACLIENACGYAPVHVEVPSCQKYQRELLVLVDNRFNFEQAPMHEPFFDFYQYGGIIRGVSLRILPESGPWIRAVRVTPGEEYAKGLVHVDLEIEMRGEVDALSLHYSCDGGDISPVGSHSELLARNLKFDLIVPNPRLWSPLTPHLHVIEFVLVTAERVVSDRQCVRFGLRQIKAREGRLWLNGEALILKGYNRHEWHPNYGPSTPTSQMFSDIQLLKDMGCNFVRGSHYHQDQRFLDLCDELGLLVWEENLGWGQREKSFSSDKFSAHHRQALIAMIRESYNHPSIICWGLLNEAGSNCDYCRPILEDSFNLMRELDPSRLVTFASMFAFDDINFDLVDMISINTYPGWYGCEKADDPLSAITPRLEAIVASIDSRGHEDKPIIISEIGAEALYGWRESHNDFFTETYQAKYLHEAIAGVLSNPRFSGIALWHFSDVRTYSGGLSLMRPRTFNNKGTLDEYRRPKEAYQVVKALFSSDAPISD
ncbi:MAG: glycoside hydrolase family 2 TIM barrel-domain containing protein [Verrucomicrobiota bacterium JB024]|nr:glycoside hydrolase family 2 TIM barrel-domain containing protein [Verrucomicrobiota bacterium JB024]